MATRSPRVSRSTREFAKQLLERHLAQLKKVVTRNGVGGLRSLYADAIVGVTRDLARVGPWSNKVTPITHRVMLGHLENAVDVLSANTHALLINVGQTAAALGTQQAHTEYAKLEQHFSGTEPTPKLDEAVVPRGLTSHDSSLLRRYELVTRTWSSQAIANIEKGMSVGLLMQKPIGEMIQEVVSDNGLLERERYRAERVVRTESAYAHGAAKFTAIRELSESRPTIAKRIIETFDDRTGDDSFLLHGQTVPVDRPFTWKHKERGAWIVTEYMFPPNRPNDRAVVIPWDTTWEDTEEDRPLSIDELETARPTFWRPKIGVVVPPGHVPGKSYTAEDEPF